jgi:methylated-DNA-[protein]-cysteine S-methyltransferase
MARNPVLIIVACHRVLGAGGRLTGYAGGLPAKRLLLDLEAQHVEAHAQLALAW